MRCVVLVNPLLLCTYCIPMSTVLSHHARAHSWCKFSFPVFSCPSTPKLANTFDLIAKTWSLLVPKSFNRRRLFTWTTWRTSTTRGRPTKWTPPYPTTSGSGSSSRLHRQVKPTGTGNTLLPDSTDILSYCYSTAIFFT